MGFSFLKRIPIFPFVSLNLSTSGVSVSAGPEGAKLNRKLIGKNAGKTRIYAQKYGVRYRQGLDGKKKTKKAALKRR